MTAKARAQGPLAPQQEAGQLHGHRRGLGAVLWVGPSPPQRPALLRRAQTSLQALFPNPFATLQLLSPQPPPSHGSEEGLVLRHKYRAPTTQQQDKGPS